jgi:glycerol-3-phosphate acyltransferase PlsY
MRLLFEVGLILLSFFSGALPISVWLGKVFIGVDIRQYGDGNPGATNVFRAGNNYIGLTALLLDVTKAALPVGIAYNILNVRGLPMFLIALAPVLGHIFSPFLGFKGGKALAASFGAWIGLTVWTVSAPAALAAALGILLFTPAGWAVLLALMVILAVILIWFPDPLLIFTWVAQTVLMVWTHRGDLKSRPQFRPWLKNNNKSADK